jgi:hypothetical protein
VPLGRIADFAAHPAVRPVDGERDAVRMAFRSVAEVRSSDFQAFLREHLGMLLA